MKTTSHSQFILTPISAIIEDTNRACISLGNGIEIHPMASYIMQTTFLRMTGASEQKLKCICWEIATFDYEFRYEMFQTPLGECSNYKDKNSVFSHICKSLKRHDVSLLFDDAAKLSLIKDATKGLKKYLETSPLSIIFEKEFVEFKDYCSSNPIKKTFFCNINRDKNISFLESDLKDYYDDYVYRQRNRYAHNLTSYQMNVPSFSQLVKTESEKNNHFRMMSLLILIDGIFIKLFEKFQDMKSLHSY